MSAPPPSADVHRLVDIVVEEVSLVDRAANRHRFLLVKRDPTMSTSPSSGAQKALPDSPLSAALSALESLTAIVDQLSSLGEAGSDVRLAALAEQLRGVAQQILEQTGFSDPTGSPSPTEVAARENKSTSSGSEVAAVLAETKQALAQVSALIGKGAPTSSPPAAPPPTFPAPPPPAMQVSVATPAAPAPAATSDVLQKVLTAVQSLATAVEAQQQRLAHVEKQVGLPNSVPHAEPRAQTDDDTGWPLDLNAPKHRQAVDKSVSFHDP